MNERKWKRGDIGPDGRVFWGYNPTSKNGQKWLTRESFDQHTLRKREDDKKSSKARRDRKRQNLRNFRNAHPEKNAEYLRKYREKNPNKAQALARDWRSKNREKVAATEKNSKAKRRDAVGSGSGITFQQWESCKRKHGHACYYCRSKSKLTMDHVIPLSKGGKHEVSNIVPACGSCNSRKHNKTPEDFARSIGLLLI